MIYSAVLVSGIQKIDSAMHMHIFMLFRFFSHIGYYRILSQFPVQYKYVLTDYFTYGSVHMLIPNS